MHIFGHKQTKLTLLATYATGYLVRSLCDEFESGDGQISPFFIPACSSSLPARHDTIYRCFSRKRIQDYHYHIVSSVDRKSNGYHVIES